MDGEREFSGVIPSAFIMQDTLLRYVGEVRVDGMADRYEHRSDDPSDR